MEALFETIQILLGGVIFFMRAFAMDALPPAYVGEPAVPTHPSHVLFAGDAMLGRHVETLMDERGIGYPFKEVSDLVSGYDLALLNFEGTVPENHEKTKDFDMRFSVREEFLGVLKDIGFDVLSLANNHAYDHGESGYTYTQMRCAHYALVCRGNPYEVNELSTEVFTLSSARLGVLFLHTLYTKHDSEALKRTVKELSERSDVQVVFIHWGNEYELIHSREQEALAHILIENGIDAVIGHHPHVIQDAELYNGKPIFYSLGNFIFDQYFSEDVGEGLMVSMRIDEESVRYELIPLESHTSKSRPTQVAHEKMQTLFSRILPSHASFTAEETRVGVITIPR